MDSSRYEVTHLTWYAALDFFDCVNLQGVKVMGWKWPNNLLEGRKD